MDFIQTVRAAADEKHVKMLDGTTPSPYSGTPSVSSQQTYKNKREKYYKRLESERSSFNKALSACKDAKARRERGENDAKTRRAERLFRLCQFLRMIVFFLPVAIGALAGWDTFDRSHGNIDKINALENFSLTWAIVLYVAYALVAVITAIALTTKMFKNQSFINRGNITYRVRYNVAAVIILCISIGIVALNFVKWWPVRDKYKVVFDDGVAVTVEYADKNEYITLPTITKESEENATFTREFTFKGWEINGELYKGGVTYMPTGKTQAVAVFDYTDYAQVSVFIKKDSNDNATAVIYLLYDDGKYEKVSGGATRKLELNSQITAIVHYVYSSSQYFTVNSENKKLDTIDSGSDIYEYLKKNNLTADGKYSMTVTGNTEFYASSTPNSSGGSSGGDTCIAEGTLITLANGETVPVESLTGNELLLVWNLEIGSFDVAPILFVDVDATTEYDVITLSFADGTEVDVIGEHAFWDVDLNKYVYMRDDAAKYIGHSFNKQVTNENGQMIWAPVELVNVETVKRVTTAYSPVTAEHLCYYVNGMLSMPGALEGFINIFDVDGSSMRYDEQSFIADLQEYGLFTYDEFKQIVPVSEEVFNAFGGKYLKISIGKGLLTVERLVELVHTYAEFLQ